MSQPCKVQSSGVVVDRPKRPASVVADLEPTSVHLGWVPANVFENAHVATGKYGEDDCSKEAVKRPGTPSLSGAMSRRLPSSSGVGVVWSLGTFSKSRK